MKKILLFSILCFAAIIAQATYTGLQYEVFQIHTEGDLAGYVTVRIYAHFDNPADRLISIYGTLDEPTGDVVAAQIEICSQGGSFYQDGFPGIEENFVEPENIPDFLSEYYDTYLTLGNPETIYDNEQNLFYIDFLENWADFDGPNGIPSFSTINDCAQFNEVLITAYPGEVAGPAGNFADDGRVMIGQFTTNASFDFCTGVQFSPEELGLGGAVYANSCISVGIQEVLDAAPSLLADVTNICGMGMGSISVQESGTEAVSYILTAVGEYSENTIAQQNSPVFENLAAGQYRVQLIGEEIEMALTPILNVFDGGISDAIVTAQDAICYGDLVPVSFAAVSQVALTGFLNGQEIEANGTLDLPDGVYTFYAEDLAGCISETITFEIAQPEQIVSEFSTEYTDETIGQGTITATVTGGTAPYSFLWSDGEASEDGLSITFESPGIYTLTVTDSNGCTEVFDTEIDLGVEDILETSIVFYPNPNNGIFTLKGSVNTGATNLYLYDLTGKLVLSELLSANAIKTGETINVQHLGAGIYNLVLQGSTDQQTSTLVIR